jgi:hypothetical protein
MSLKSKKATIERTSGKSVQTNAAESSQEQPTTRPDGTTSETASDAAGTKATTIKSQSIAAISATNTKLANACSRVSKQTAIVPQIHKIEQFQFDCPDWKDKAELKSAWDINQRELAIAATAAMNKQAEVYICLAKARAILSQRGDKYAKMRDEAGIRNPKTGKRLTWTEYFAWFQSEYNFEKCLRAVQFKLAEMAGKKRVTKKSGPSLQLTGSDKRKLIDSALESHQLVEAFRKGGDVDTAVKELQKNLPPKDKLLDLVDDAPRLLKSDNGAQIAKPTVKSKPVSADGVDWNDPSTQNKVLSVLRDVSKQLQQGDLAIKVRRLISELIGRPSTAQAVMPAVTRLKVNGIAQHAPITVEMSGASSQPESSVATA